MKRRVTSILTISMALILVIGLAFAAEKQAPAKPPAPTATEMKTTGDKAAKADL